MVLEIQVQGWDRNKNVAGLNPLMGSDNWISNNNMYDILYTSLFKTLRYNYSYLILSEGYTS